MKPPRPDDVAALPPTGVTAGAGGGSGTGLGRLLRRLTPAGPAAASLPLMEYVKYHTLSRLTPSFPHVIQVQTQYGCNARCVFCPMGREKNAVHGHMDDATFQSIVDQAVAGGTKMLSPYLQNDPLVDRRLGERIAYIRQRRGRRLFPQTKIITNAGLLDEDRAAQLISAGLDRIVFSVQGLDPHIHDQLMQGPRLETVLRNIKRFLRIQKELGSTSPKVEVWAVRTKEIAPQIDATRRFWRAMGVRFKARELDNRAHPEINQNTDLAAPDRPWRYADHCVIPFWRAWILVDGDVVLCCVDWERKHVFGNIHDATLKEIWTGPAYRAYRQRMRCNDFRGTLCETCQGT